jgi:signal transduction histidine kinase
VEPLVDDVVERWRGTLAAAGRPLHARVRTRPALASAAPRVVDQILEVLVSNSYRHGAGAITVAVRETGGWLSIEVADEGPGFAIPVEQAFSRRSPSRDGHGIGLTLARALAHAEGGRLDVADSGAHPTVRLLLRAVVAERSAGAATDRAPIA